MVSPIILVVLPLAAAFLITLIGSRGIARLVALLASLGTVWIAATWLLPSAAAPTTIVVGGIAAPLGIGLAIDALGAGFAVLVAVSLTLVVLYSFSYIGGEHDGANEAKYYAVLLLLGAASFGLLLTRDLFNLFVFYEILCIASYILVAYGQDRRALEASFKYMLLGSLGSLLMLIAIGLAYRAAGSLAMADVAAALAAGDPGYALLTAVLFFFGMAIEAAIFPVNTWLPDAHSSAPSSISAVLSGFVIELALVVLLRLVGTVFGSAGLGPILPILALLGVLVGEIAAFSQTELKRMLAYSSMGQVGLILFALSLGTVAGREAGLTHLLMHTGAKSALFLIAGYFIVRTDRRDIESYRGLALRMPVSSVLFALAALSLIGVPPFFGFFSKFRILAAASSHGGAIAWGGIAVILLGTVLEGFYLFRVVRVLFERDDALRATGVPVAWVEPSAPALVATALFVLLAILGGVVLAQFDLILGPAASALAVL